MKIQRIGYLLLVPAFIFIFIFSLFPVAKSAVYSLFDYQLNDPSRSRLSISESYNLAAYEETSRYMLYYLDSELAVATKPEVSTEIRHLMGAVEEADARLKETYGILKAHEPVRLGAAETETIHALSAAATVSLDRIYGAGDTGLQLKDDLRAVSTGYEKAFVKSNFIGLGNYTRALNDARMWAGMSQTVIFTLFSVSFELVLGILLALVMNKAMRGQGMIRVLSLIPWAIPTVVSALIWLYLYNGSSGIVSHIFAAMGIISSPSALLLTGTHAMGAVVLADVWKTTPYMALMILAGLQTIPSSYYEAASIDGATRVQQFFKITLPMLKGSILVALLFRTLDAFRVFDLIWVLTGGGPGGQTETISIYAYKAMFAQTQFGYGSALAVLIALCVGLISYFFIRVLDVDLISREG